MFTRTAVMVTGLLVFGLVACSEDGPQDADSSATTVPVATVPAPSQVTASTIAAPSGVPPCAVDELQFSAGEAGIVVIHNAGAIECEVDVSQSPNRDPLMEPSIWLHAGGDGELAVEADDEGCAQPAAVSNVDLVVNGQPVQAPASVPAACRVTLTAIYTD
jgi:hypothetical protein